MVEAGIRPTLKRPLSFSDDSFEWDSVRDDTLGKDGWKALKVDCDDNVMVASNGLPVDWAPYGCERARKGKKPRQDQKASNLALKKTCADTFASLDDEDERDVAKQIVLSISKYSGSFAFESSDKDTYARLVPFSVDNPNTKMSVNDDWQLGKFDCNLESLFTKTVSTKVNSISFPQWKDAKRRERKHELVNVKRESNMEDMDIEDGTFSWAKFVDLVKPQFVTMEPKARFAAAKQLSDIIQGDLSAASESIC
ncbi:hypothetical protein GCK32_000210 [Trichostrongylus colubriformis]|uniref:Uncharacterized protein n=1 Tax=Trichostrongylus colubriformis TaxID=6319 RepID=A0AAN8F4D0_TRICO